MSNGSALYDGSYSRVAELRDLSLSDAPVLFKINMSADHAGASGRFQRLEEVAYEYAFALTVVGKA